MKFKILNSRGKFQPELSLGAPMWTTRDGQKTHHATEYACWFASHKHGDTTQLIIIPTIFINTWHRGVLSSIDELGTISYNCSIGIKFWNWYGTFTFMRVLNTKTTAEINKNLELNWHDKVL